MPNDTVSKIKRVAWLLEYMSLGKEGTERTREQSEFYAKQYPDGTPFPIRTARRDLKLIKAAGIPCKGYLGKWDKRPAFTFTDGFVWKAMGLTYNTAASLCVLYETLGKDAYTFKKTRRTLHGWLGPRKLTGCSLAPSLELLPKTPIYKQLQQAIAERRFIEITWKKRIKPEPSVRCIRPTQFIIINGEWYIGGLAATRANPICERIEDMASVSDTVINTPVFKAPGLMRWKIWNAVSDKLTSLSASSVKN